MNWDFLRFFVALAEHGSLNGAARVLGTSHTTVGRNITQYEQRVGVRLFDKIGNRYFLNSDGRRIYEHARDVRDRIRRIGELLDLGTPIDRQRLRIATTPFISDNLLPSVVGRFLDLDFALSVDAVLGQDFSSALDEAYPLAISQYRIGRSQWSAHRLGELELGFYCTRQYLDTAPLTVNERHLRSHRLALWTDFQRAQRGGHAGELKALADASMIVSDGLHLVLQTALQGNAIATLPVFVARAYPELLAVLQDMPLSGLPIWSHMNQKLGRSSDARRLNELLAEAIPRLPERET